MGAVHGSPTPLAAGVDIGGSKVLAVALGPARETLGEVRLPTGSGAYGVVSSAVAAVRRLADRLGVPVTDFPVVGIGVPGLVQPDSGIVSHAVNLGMVGVDLDLGGQLASRLDVPVAVENDVNMAALGAAHLLGLDGLDLAFLAIGTGLGAGLLTGGRIRHGARGAAGEVGHVPVDPAGARCRCGQRGCLETVASGSAIAAAWPVAGGSPAAALFAAAEAGDPRALLVRNRLAHGVAAAVRLLVLTQDVETVVLGGGVAEVGVRLLDVVIGALREQSRGSAFLAALELPSRVAVVPPGLPVAAVGAALSGALAREEGRTMAPADGAHLL